ncbi:MAG TPA: type I methionyl aminopeptidase [Bdellovibrionales bacterium]|nr:type I methionyl aminopeptidase [Bdellovibrionales bacterium]
MTPLKPDEIPKMREAGRLAARTLENIAQYIRAGITTDEIDKIIHDFTLSHGATPAPLGYHGYPKSSCTSINDCICHGLPGETKLRDGDVINVDITCIKDGFYGDTSRTFFVGEVSEQARDITDVAEKAMWKGIEEVRPFATTGDIGFAINKLVTKRGYHVVREIGGHGIGKVFHDDPFVPSYGKKGRGPKLLPWCCITVEPMILVNDVPFEEYDIPGSEIKYYLTGDKTVSSQFEHTVLVTDTGYEIMTLP